MRIQLQSKGIAFGAAKYRAYDIINFCSTVKKGCEVSDVPDIGGAVCLCQAGAIGSNPTGRLGWMSSDALKPIPEFGLDTEGNDGQFPVMFSVS